MAKQAASNWSGAGVGRTLDRLVLDACNLWSQRCAVQESDRASSFEELERLSARVATALAARGVKPRSRVALSVGRGVHGLAAVLGVLRLGGVYVPLPAHDPEERVRLIIEDAEPAAVLAENPQAPGGETARPPASIHAVAGSAR